MPHDHDEDLTQVLLQELIAGAVTILVVLVAAWAERAASSADPVPPLLRNWWGRQRQRSDEGQQFAHDLRRMQFEVYSLLGPGCLDITEVDR